MQSEETRVTRLGGEGYSKEVFYGTNGFVEYTPGDMNLIISIPHGGYLKPNAIPDRTKSCRGSSGSSTFPLLESFSPTNYSSSHQQQCHTHDCALCKAVCLYGDAFTQEIGAEIVKKIGEITGKTPHVIQSNLHRVKLDPNRPIAQAAHGNLEAEKAYNEYHKFIIQAKAEFQGAGLIIDLHGQNHGQNSTELGYVFMKNDLNDLNFTKDVPSINSLLRRSGLDVTELLFGANSLGAMFESLGYRAVPSPKQPVPGDDKYYRGGYITQIHGSREGGLVDAVQVEVPGEIRYGEEEERTKYGQAVARILTQYMNLYYQL